MAISSAEPERGFSLMNRIKCDWRSTLNLDTRNDLMTIEMSNKNLAYFNPTRAVSLWWNYSVRGSRVVNPHGPHNMKKNKKDKSDTDSYSDSE